MKRRWIAVTLALALLAGLLTGCGKKLNGTEQFYTLAEEFRQLRDARVSMTVPYHGAVVQVEGFVSCTNQQADLTFTLSGTPEQDGEWTEIRVIGNDIWLDVGQMSKATCAFPLTEVRMADMQELTQTQTASWMCYTWEGDFWQETEQWRQEWFDGLAETRESLGSYVKAASGGYAMSLNRETLEKAGVNVDELIGQYQQDMSQRFVDTLSQQINLSFAFPQSLKGIFDKCWTDFFGRTLTGEDELIDLDQVQIYDEEGEKTEMVEAAQDDASQPSLTDLTLALSNQGEEYKLTLDRNGQSYLELTLTPASQMNAEPPEQEMSFEQYYTDIYELVSLSREYIADILDGTQPEEDDPEHTHALVEEEMPPAIQHLSVFEIPGYSDLKQINYLDENGALQQVPILTGYKENMVTSVDNDGEVVTQLTLNAEAWYQEIYTLEAEQSLEEDLQEEIDEYQDIYIEASGGQLLEWPGEPVLSEDGSCGTLGFSFQENPMAETRAKVMVLLHQKNAKAYTVLDFSLFPDRMTDSQVKQFNDLCRFLGVEAPIQLNLQ